MSDRQLEHAQHRPAGPPLPLRLMAHDVALAANVGALFRLADALGVERLYLAGRTLRPPDVRLRRAARSTQAHVPWQACDDAPATLRALRAEGFRIVSLELTRDSLDLARAPLGPGERVCLVVGAEDAGVAQALLDASDFAVHIPMRGVNSSMNVATAAAIALYEIGRRVA